MSYDKQCYALALAFLRDNGLASTNACQALAQEIQDTIEEFIYYAKKEQPRVQPETRSNGPHTTGIP